jgi:glycosyltransferase involved in cell wall biosynthesis
MIISIITINYNNKLGLKKTIESVIQQNTHAIEYIIIDGNSNDGSLDLILEHQTHIQYWVSEKDNGIYHAMNKGIEKANGDYLLFLNSGDYLYNNSVVATVLDKKINADIAYGNMIIDHGNKQEIGKMPESITFDQMFFDTLWHPVSFIKKELFQRFGNYDESYKIVGDYEWFFKVLVKHTVSSQYLGEIISVYNMEGISSQPKYLQKNLDERKKVWESHLSPMIINYMLSNKAHLDDLQKPSLLKRILNRLK